jgi:hypothetical protein
VNFSGAGNLIILSKLLLAAKSSVFASIKFAFAPARDDSDWAKSVKVISPFCRRELSVSTCLSNKSTLAKLN